MHVSGEMIQIIVNWTLIFNLPSEQGKVDAPGGEPAVIGVHLSHAASFSETPFGGAGAWPPPLSLPKEKAFSGKVGAGNGTVCPPPALNPVSAGAQSWKRLRSFQEQPGTSGWLRRLRGLQR